MSTAQQTDTTDERGAYYEYLDAMEDVPFGWTLSEWLHHARECGTCETCTR